LWTNKDPTSIGRLKNKDTLKRLIPGLGEPKKIVPYEDRIKKEREDRKVGKGDLAKDLLAKSIDYFIKNFKETKIKIDPKKTLDENLDVLTEEQLFEVNYILDFCHEPKGFDRFDVSRMIISIPDHVIMKTIIAKLKKYIPAFKQRLELIKLETQESDIEKRKKELRINIAKAQANFKERTVESVMEKVEKFDMKNVPLTCTYPGCEKVCNSPAGMASHLRSHKPKKPT